MATDEVERLIAAFGAHGKRDQTTWKLDVLMDLTAHDDPRVVAFLRDVLTDAEEPGDVRIDALHRLREAALDAAQRPAVAAATARVLNEGHDGELRLHATLALGDFADVPGVVAALGSLALAAHEPLELRYNAFTSLQRAGPTAEGLTLLAALRADELLGQSAASVLAAWGHDAP
jgi:hypothetical protein